MEYKPKPIDTSSIRLDDRLLELVEALSENVHAVWVRQRLKDGWRYGHLRDDSTRRHPCLVPYDALPDSEKQYDRNAVLETVKAILASGYRIEPDGNHGDP